MDPRLVVALSSLAVATGCGDTTSVDLDTRDNPVFVAASPADRSTRVGDTDLVVTLYRNGPELPAELVDRVPSALTVTTADGPVAVMFIIDDEAAPGTTLDFRHTFRLRARAWAPAWHTLAIDRALAEDGLQSDGTLAVDHVTGALFARFHPQSHPLVRAVRACRPSGDTPAKVLVELSEPGLADADAADVHAEGESCTLTESGSVTTLGFTCPAGVSSVSVRLVALATPEGAPFTLVDQDGNELALDADDATPVDATCAIWRL